MFKQKKVKKVLFHLILLLIFALVLQAVLSKLVKIKNAGVVELVDTLDLGSSAARCESSSLSARTFLTTNK